MEEFMRSPTALLQSAKHMTKNRGGPCAGGDHQVRGRPHGPLQQTVLITVNKVGLL